MEKLDRFCSSQLYFTDITGMCVSVRKGDFLFTGAYGMADYEKQIPMSEDDMFPCASLAKLVTADLVRENLEMTEDVVHMLSHTTGISEEGLYLWDPSEYRFSYDDTGYDRLGRMLESKTGRSFRDMANEKLSHYGMKRATFDKCEVVPGHFKDNSNNIVRDKRYRYEEEHLPSSGLISDIHDIDKMAMHYMDLDKYGPMFKPVADIPATGEKMGLGFFIRQIENEVFYGHDAGDYGYRGTLWICPGRGVSAAVIANRSAAPVRKIADGLIKLVLNE